MDRSGFGRLDARVKLAVGMSVSLLAVLLDGAAALGLLTALGMVCFAATAPSGTRARLVLGSCALLTWSLVLGQGLFYEGFPRHAWLEILPANRLLPDGLKLYAEGVAHGLRQSLRLLAGVFCGYAICFTTSPDQFLRALLALRLPFGLSFMAVTAIRFVPVAAREFGAVRTAMRLKGYRPFRRGLAATARTEIASLRPVLAATIRRSQEVALAIVARGFSPAGGRTRRANEPLRAGEMALLSVLLLLVAAVAGAKILFWLYRQQLYYHPSLRELYAFAREWL